MYKIAISIGLISVLVGCAGPKMTSPRVGEVVADFSYDITADQTSQNKVRPITIRVLTKSVPRTEIGRLVLDKSTPKKTVGLPAGKSVVVSIGAELDDRPSDWDSYGSDWEERSAMTPFEKAMEVARGVPPCGISITLITNSELTYQFKYRLNEDIRWQRSSTCSIDFSATNKAGEVVEKLNPTMSPR